MSVTSGYDSFHVKIALEISAIKEKNQTLHVQKYFDDSDFL